MNCRSCQQLILLVLSKEANAWQCARVDRHLRECSVCREFRADCIQAEQAVRSLSPEPGSNTVDAVLSYGRRELIRRQSNTRGYVHFDGLTMLRPAWLYGTLSIAALLAFLLIMEPVMRPQHPDVAHRGIPQSAAPSELAKVEEWPDVETYLDELIWILDATYLDNIASENEKIISWATTEQLAAELLAWEESEI